METGRNVNLPVDYVWLRVDDLTLMVIEKKKKQSH